MIEPGKRIYYWREMPTITPGKES